MKLLQINTCYGYASTGRIISELAEQLDNDGHDCRVAYGTALNPRSKDIRIGNVVDRKIHALMSRVFGLQGYFSYFATKRLVREIIKFAPDIVHLHNLHSNYLNFKVLYKHFARSKTATVITLHDCFPYTGKCTYYTLDKCYKWKEACGTCTRIHKDNASILLDNTSKMLNDKIALYKALDKLGVIGVSDWITNEARQSLLSSASKIKRIYNWIDLEVFKIKQNDARSVLKLDNKFVILSVAIGWSDRKGLNKLIDLASQVDGDTRIVVVGKMASGIILPENIIHINATNNVEELVAYYNMADVMYVPSMEETFGKVTAEAMACGTPVIVMNSTASPELVGENCGFVNDSFTTEETLRYLADIKANTKQSYSADCRKFVENNFEKNNLIAEHVKFYKEMIALKDKNDAI